MPLVRAREIERHYFEQFRKHFRLPEGAVIYGDKPDVQVVGAHLLGIEIARLYIASGTDPDSEQVQSARREQVLAQAQKLHQRRGGRSIELNIDFDPAQPILNVPDAAAKLASLADEIQYDAFHRDGNLHGNAEGLRFVYNSGIEYADAKWRNTQSFTVPTVNPERIRAIVDDKTKKVEDYARCDEFWLLLIVDFMDRAQDQELTLPQDFCLAKGTFERVLLYKPQFAQIVEVPSTPPRLDR